jgi:hypothetical protein
LEIWHRITFGHLDRVDSAILDLGLDHKKSPLPGDGYLIHIDIEESNPAWPEVKLLVQKKQSVDICDTFFSNEELLASEWVRLAPTYEHGYPLPKDWSVNPINYSECSTCGKFNQNDPFRMANEPKMGKNNFFCLYWTYTLFADNQVFDELENNKLVGFSRLDLIIDKNNKPSNKVSQVKFLSTAKAGISQLDNLDPLLCSECKTKKYSPHKRGLMKIKKSSLEKGIDIMESTEWFGSGHSAYREIIISNKLAKIILVNNWKGVRMKAIYLD